MGGGKSDGGDVTACPRRVTVTVFGHRAALALSGRAMRRYITRASFRLNFAKPSFPRRASRRPPSLSLLLARLALYPVPNLTTTTQASDNLAYTYDLNMATAQPIAFHTNGNDDVSMSSGSYSNQNGFSNAASYTRRLVGSPSLSWRGGSYGSMFFTGASPGVLLGSLE